MAALTGSPVTIPYFLAGIDLAATIPVLVLGSPPTIDGTSRKSGPPRANCSTADHDTNALLTSM